MNRRSEKTSPKFHIFKERRGLIILLSSLLILAFALYFFLDFDLIFENTVVFPTLPAFETVSEPSESQIIDNPILITEIMSSNQSTLQTADLNTPDWIEFYNAGSVAIHLKDYALSDNINRPKAYTFPDITLEPGAYLIIYASELSDPQALATAEEKGEWHAPFRLAKTGEELYFTNPAGQVLAQLEIPEIPDDVSWGLLDGATRSTDPYYFFSEPTPGLANGKTGYTDPEEAIPIVTCDLIVNEYITRQDQWVDPEGDYPDWVEFYNSGTEPFHLLGCFLSDDPNDLEQWSFPDIVVEPGAFLVVYLSGKDATYVPGQPATLQASFRLSEKDEQLILSDARGRKLIDQPLLSPALNVSYGRSCDQPDAWLYFPRPTPGGPNDTQGFEALEGALMLKNRGVWINEVCALDAAVVKGKKTSHPDWIELFNGTETDLDLTGYGLSDDRDEPYLESLDGIIIPSGGYVVIEPTAFGLSTDGETVWLTGPDQMLIDRFTTGALANGMSSGRSANGADEPVDSRYFFKTPTPGGPNNATTMLGYSLPLSIEAVTASGGQPVSGLYLNEPILVSLISQQPNAVIYYTLDGSLPDEHASVYTESILIDQTTVIRCLSIVPGYMASQTSVRTFLFEEPHDLPVVSIIGNPADFFDETNGLLTNYKEEIEHPAEILFYEADGTLGVQFTAGIDLHGSYSRTEKQKSLELKARAQYGDSQVTYPFFPGNDVSTFKRLILRTSGQDWRFTKLRDIFMTEVIKGYAELDTMDDRPCVVYLNGAYFGLYNLREKVDQYYVASHYGVDPDNVDIIKGNAIILNGDYEAYDALLSYVKTHDMKDDKAYQTVLSQIDEYSLMDFVITQSFFNNLDSGNKKFWRERSDQGEWRWVFFDLDWAMFPTTYTLNILKYDLLDPAGHGQSNIFDSTLQVKLMENPEFREAFIERYAWFLNHVFTTDRMLSILDRLTETIRSEMPRQIERWGEPRSFSYWEEQIAELRRITSEKRERTIRILQESFDLDQARMKALFPEDFS